MTYNICNLVVKTDSGCGILCCKCLKVLSTPWLEDYTFPRLLLSQTTEKDTDGHL